MLFKKYNILILLQFVFILSLLLFWSIFHQGRVAEYFWSRFIRIPESRASHFYLFGFMMGIIESGILYLFFYLRRKEQVKDVPIDSSQAKNSDNK